jgi:hypothetical protein
MKKKLHLILLTLIVLGNAFSNAWATQYCQTPITATDNVTTVRLSCQMISDGNYQIKIESDADMDGLGGSFCYINGVGGYQLSALPGYNLSSDKKIITVDIPSTSAPNLHTPLYILMPEEKNFPWPSDIEWGLCSSGSTDNVPPVMGSASVVGTPAYNSVNLLLSASDDVTSPVVSFIVNDVANNIVNKILTADGSGNATLSGLNPGTTYNLTINARDAAGNVSSNSVSLTVTTADRSSDCSGDKGHFGTPSLTKIHYSIQYFGGNVIYTISPIDAARTIDYAEVQASPGGNHAMTIAGDGKSATYTMSGLSVGTSVGVLFLYSFDNMPGNEMTSQSTSLSDANTIYYKVGDCEVSDTEAPTAFTASAGTVTSTSVELLLNATDNSGVVVYTVSYGSTPTVVTQNGTSGSQKSIIINGLTPNTVYTFSVEAKDLANNPAANNPITINATTKGGLTDPATTPDKSASKVISIYSDVYPSVSGLNLNPNWGQATIVSEIQVNGNNTLKYENLNYQGTEFSHITPIASGMTHLHIDVWTENETSLQLYPICWNGSANEPEKFVNLSPLKFNEWNSFDIPLTDFTSQGLTMADVYQFKIVGSGSKTIYIDNLYFYNDFGTSAANLKENDLIYYSSVVKDVFIVKSKLNIARIEFRNLLGQSIKNVELSGLEANVNLTEFPAGNYIFNITFSNGSSMKAKLIKR